MMKEFEFENNMNENTNAEETIRPETNETANAAPEYTEQPTETETTASANPVSENAQESEPVNPAPQNTANPAPYQSQNGQQTGSYQQPAQTQNNYVYPQPAQNAYNQQNSYNGYGYQNQQNQQRTQYNPYPNGSAQYTGRTYNAYGAQANNGQPTGQIAYAPQQKQKKQKKAKKSSSTGVVAAICCAAVILSGVCGFGGTMLANHLNDKNTSVSVVEDRVIPSTLGGEAISTSGDSIVIYKSVDDVVTSTSTTSGDDLTYAQVAALVKDSVVEINTEFSTRNPYFPQFIQQASGAGSGVIISEDGYIITNAHVITGESSGEAADSILVRLTSGEEYDAEVVAFDSDEDIAVIKINATGLTPARCGDSDKLTVGEELIVVGNPLGELGGSVSNGIVSATEREITMDGVTMHLIQTNAAVNPGNSGGGMFNMKGQLVGIVNAKSSGSGIEGLGFAIPVNQALTVTDQLLTQGYVSGKPMIGVSFSDVSNSNYFFYYSVRSGVYVAELAKGYNDDVLKEGDRVIAVNGQEISTSEEIKAIVYASSIGDKLTFQLYRNGKLMEVEVTVYERTPDADVQNSITFDEDNTPNWLDDFFGNR